MQNIIVLVYTNVSRILSETLRTLDPGVKHDPGCGLGFDATDAAETGCVTCYEAARFA